MAMAKGEPGFQVTDKPEDCFWPELTLFSWINADRDVLLVAEDEDNQGKIVGFVTSILHRPTGKATWENQMVLLEYRGQGVGTALKNELIKQLRSKGITYVCFLTSPRNVAIYQNMGFDIGKEFIWFGMHL